MLARAVYVHWTQFAAMERGTVFVWQVAVSFAVAVVPAFQIAREGTVEAMVVVVPAENAAAANFAPWDNVALQTAKAENVGRMVASTRAVPRPATPLVIARWVRDAKMVFVSTNARPSAAKDNAGSGIAAGAAGFAQRDRPVSRDSASPTALIFLRRAVVSAMCCIAVMSRTSWPRQRIVPRLVAAAVGSRWAFHTAFCFPANATPTNY